jgi:hypothetical protein
VAKSEAAEMTGKGVRAPRWILEAWLWVSVPAWILSSSGCPIRTADRLCMAVGSSWLPALFNLFPMTLQGFAPQRWPLAAVYAGLTGLVVLCVLLLRRLAPRRLPLGLFLAIVVGWLALSFTTEATAIGHMMGVSPIELFRAMLSL